MELIKTDEFNIIYKDMLAQFPKSELKSYEKFLKLFGENYILYKVVDGEFAGYIILFEYGDFIFIDCGFETISFKGVRQKNFISFERYLS